MSQSISETKAIDPRAYNRQTIIIRSTTANGDGVIEDSISKIIAPISISDIQSIRNLELIAGQISIARINQATISNIEIADADGSTIISDATIFNADIENASIHDIEIHDGEIVGGTITGGTIIIAQIDINDSSSEIKPIIGACITNGAISCGYIQ